MKWLLFNYKQKKMPLVKKRPNPSPVEPGSWRQRKRKRRGKSFKKKL